MATKRAAAAGHGQEGQLTGEAAGRARQHTQHKANLAPLDGIRALCNATIVLTHVTCMLGIPPHHHAWRAALQAHPLLRLSVSYGLPAMDTFFLLTGLLACYHLVPAMQQGPPVQAALTYLKRRVLRIVPSYCAAILLYWAVIQAGQVAGDPYIAQRLSMANHTVPVDTSPAYFVRCLLFIQPWPGCLGFAWNLAVQVQFYALLPLLLLLLRPKCPGFTGRVVGLSVALLAVSLAWRSSRVHMFGMRLLLPLFQVPGDPGFRDVELFFNHIYMSAVARLSQLAIGVLLGCWALSPAAMELVRRWWLLTTCAAAAAVALVAAAASAVPDVELTKEAAQATDAGAAHFAFVWFMGLILPTALAIVIVFVLSGAGPVAPVARRVASFQVWKAPAQLSYAVYLLHILAIQAVWAATTALLGATPEQLFLAPASGAGSGQLLQHLSVLLCLWCVVYGLSAAGSIALESALACIMG